MASTTYFISLPDDVLIPLLGAVGSSSLPDLVEVAQTCRKLNALIFKDDRQHVWEEVHRRLYDNPRDACAFLTPRAHYEWKQIVIDRHLALRFIPPPPPPLNDAQLWHLVDYSAIRLNRVKPLGPDVKAWFDRSKVVVKAILGLYLDLPAVDGPSVSANAKLLGQLISPAKNTSSVSDPYASPLAALCWCYDLYAPSDNDERIQLEVLLSHVDLFRYRVEQNIRFQDAAEKAGRLSFLYPQPKPPRWERWLRLRRREHKIETDDATTPGPSPSLGQWGRNPHQTPWHAVHKAAFAPWHMLSSDNCNIQPQMEGLRTIRGQGLLGLRRPLHLALDDVWDWPNLSGRWFGTSAEYVIAMTRGWFNPSLQLQMSADPGFVNLIAVNSVDDVVAAMRDFGFSHDKALVRWNKLAREVHLAEDSPLPPVYFHGIAYKFHRVDLDWEEPERRIVYGVVRLTTDTPPQLHWTLAMSKSYPWWPGNWADYVFHGVQVGGRGSERGVLGTYNFGSFQERGALFRADDWPSAAAT